MLDEKFMTVLAKKLPSLEELVMSKGRIEHSSLAALVDHCPRLQLLDAGGCHTFNSIGESLQARLESKIKDLRLPRLQDVRLRGRIGLVRAVPFPPPTGRLGRQLKPFGMLM
jgi:hypothetical protein